MQVVKMAETRAPYLKEFQGDKLESFLFESLDDFSNKTALNSVRLDHDVGAFRVGCHFASWARCMRDCRRADNESREEAGYPKELRCQYGIRLPASSRVRETNEER